MASEGNCGIFIKGYYEKGVEYKRRSQMFLSTKFFLPLNITCAGQKSKENT